MNIKTRKKEQVKITKFETVPRNQKLLSLLQVFNCPCAFYLAPPLAIFSPWPSGGWPSTKKRGDYGRTCSFTLQYDTNRVQSWPVLSSKRTCLSFAFQTNKILFFSRLGTIFDLTNFSVFFPRRCLSSWFSFSNLNMLVKLSALSPK